MNIYALIVPGKDHKPCIQSFSTLELANRAKEIYGLRTAEVVEVPLSTSDAGLREWTDYQWPVHLYFVLDPSDFRWPVVAFTESNAYQDHILPNYPDHPWVDGTLDGLRRSAEFGLRMFRVHMHENGELGAVEGALDFNAVTTSNAHFYSLDHEMRKCEAARGSNWVDGPYFIYVYALDEADARNRAQPHLERKLKERRVAVH